MLQGVSGREDGEGNERGIERMGEDPGMLRFIVRRGFFWSKLLSELAETGAQKI